MDRRGGRLVTAVANWMPGLRVLLTYDKDWLRPDILAGLTVFAVLVPQGMAYGSLAGVAPVAGLYAAIAALVAYAVFGSSPQLAVGPESGIAIIAAASVAPLATGTTPTHYAALAAMLALLVGVILIAGGLAKGGIAADFLSKPILLGYMNGVALIVIVSQLGKLLGINIGGENFLPTLRDLGAHLDQSNGLTLAIGLTLIAFLILTRRFFPRIPGALIAVIVTTGASAAFGLEHHGVAVVGPVPRGLPAPQLPGVGFQDVYDLLPAAFGVALVAFADGILTARLFADKHDYEIDANQEMIGLGAANIASGLFQGFPSGASNSRSVVNDDAGGRSQLGGLITAALVAVFLLFFTSWLSQLPTVTLGAIVIVAATGLFQFGGILRLYKVLKVEALLATATLVAVLWFGILYGILLAVALSLLTVVARISRPHTAVLGPVVGVDGFQEIDPNKSSQTIPGLIAYRFDAPLFYANANYFLDEVRDLVRKSEPGLKWFLLDAEGIVNADATAVDALQTLSTELQKRGIVLAIARAYEPLRDTLERGHIVERTGVTQFYPTVRTAVEAYLLSRAEQGDDTVRLLGPAAEALGALRRYQDEIQNLSKLHPKGSEPPHRDGEEQ